MTTITCDTTPDGDGNINAVIYQTGLTRNPDVWNGVNLGDTITLIDAATGATTTGTLTAAETSMNAWGQNGDTALRVELTILPN